MRAPHHASTPARSGKLLAMISDASPRRAKKHGRRLAANTFVHYITAIGLVCRILFGAYAPKRLLLQHRSYAHRTAFGRAGETLSI